MIILDEAVASGCSEANIHARSYEYAIDADSILAR